MYPPPRVPNRPVPRPTGLRLSRRLIYCQPVHGSGSGTVAEVVEVVVSTVEVVVGSVEVVLGSVVVVVGGSVVVVGGWVVDEVGGWVVVGVVAEVLDEEEVGGRVVGDEVDVGRVVGGLVTGPVGDTGTEESDVVDSGVVVVVVVVEVVGAGMVTRAPNTGTVVVVTGPKTSPVVDVLANSETGSSSTPRLDPGANVVPSPDGISEASTTGAPAPTRSMSQLTPATTANTTVPAASSTIVADMSRPMKTLLRTENRVVDGASLAARRCAICLASSSRLTGRRPLGWGNRYSLLPAAPARAS